MPLDAASWQIVITAADKTSAAFASLEKKIAEAQKQMDGLGDTFSKSLGDKAATLAAKAFGNEVAMLAKYAKGFAAAAAPAAIAAYAFQQAMSAGEAMDQASRLGVSTEALQAYRAVALDAGVGAKTLDASLQTLGATMQSANAGNVDAIAQFDKLGVKLLDANGRLRPVADVLPEVARGLLGMSNETDKAASAQAIFGENSSKVMLALPRIAAGTSQVTESMRQQGRLLSTEAVEAWRKLDNQIDAVKINANIVVGNLAAPWFAAGFEYFNSLLTKIISNLDVLKQNAATATERTDFKGATEDAASLLKKLQEVNTQLDKEQGKIRQQGTTTYRTRVVDNLTKKQQELQGQLDTARAIETRAKQALVQADDEYARRGKLPVEEPTDSEGKKNPKGGGIAGGSNGEDSAERRLGVLLAERQALERAMQQFSTKFNIRENESVAEVEKKLQRSVDLEKQIANLTKNVPKDSPVAQQLAAEATAISELNAKWEEYRKISVGAEGTISRYGDGSKELSRAQAELNKQLAAGKITQEEYNWAMKDGADKAKQQELAARGAAGGFTGFSAGIESVLRPASQMSREFQYGQKAAQLLDDAINQMVNNGEVNFQRLLASFLVTIAQMEARAAVSSLWNLAFGSSGGAGGAAGAGAGGLISGLVSGIGSMFGPSLSTLQGGIGPGGQVLLFADGGRPPPNRASIVGERGPELFVPDSAGTIIPNDQLGGGGDTVMVSMSNSFGGGVTHAEMLRYGAMIEERAKAGAMAGIEAKRKRGGSIKQVFRG